MTPPQKNMLLSGARVTGLGTLLSRVLGMLRDIATAALLGLSAGGVMDAFALAIRIPNLFRRLFAEGALAASYLPVLTARFEEGPDSAWKLVSVVMTWLAVTLAAIVLLIESVFGAIWLLWGDIPSVSLLLGLAAVMLPYMFFICLAAQFAATLHVLSHFSTPALTPTLLNIVWLLGAWCVAPYFSGNVVAQAYVLAVCVVIAGVLQLMIQGAVLRSFGFRYQYDWASSRTAVFDILRAMGVMVFGLAVTQVNTLMDSLIAWGLAAAPGGPQTVAWLPGHPAYPMRQGAAAAIYFGERLYQFPLGIVGLAVATAIFPLLSRHAARGDRESLGRDVSLGLRLVLFLAIPAGVGLVYLADPLAELLFQRGRFDAEDTRRAAGMIAAYGWGVWAYCTMPVIIRAFYSLGDRSTPVRVGACIVGLNFTLNLILVWFLAEQGLAFATSIAASVQAVVLIAVFSRRGLSLDYWNIGRTVLLAVIGSLLMWLAGELCLEYLAPEPAFVWRAVRVLLPVGVSAAVYMGLFALARGSELSWVLRGRP